MFRTLSKIKEHKIFSIATIKFLIKEFYNVFEKKVERINILILGPFFYLIIKLISPIKLIRIGEIETRLIGHYSFSIDLYLAEKESGIHDKVRSLDLFFKNKKIANKFIYLKWKKYFLFGPRFILSPLYHFMLEYKKESKHLVPYRHWKIYSPGKNQFSDLYNVLDRKTCYLKFTNEEINKCNKILLRHDIHETDKLICFHIRDPYFHGGIYPKYGVRDSPISIFEPAMLYLAEKGYKVVRVGRKAHCPISVKHKNIFDYAFSESTSDMMDIFLMWRTLFVIGTLSGLEMIAKMFRKRVCVLNVAEWRACDQYPKYIPLFLPKKFEWKESKRLLTISEIINTKSYLFSFPYQFENLGIIYKDNSPEDILDAAKEMLNLFLNEDSISISEINLQNKFLSLIPPRNGLKFTTRISTSFIKKNQEILI